jgi:hypothetical protein
VHPLELEFQPGFTRSQYAGKNRVTRRDCFLAKMESVVPRSLLVGGVEFFSQEGKRGRPPLGIELSWHRKVRYWCPAKKLAQLDSLSASANLTLAQRSPLGAPRA